jgi:uncharacterized membrane protein YbhN (UPF0104 family)
MKIERPYSLAIATTTFGAFLGLLPTVAAAARAMQSPASLSAADLAWHVVYCCIFAILFAVAVATGIYAWRGTTDARKLLEEIKSRPSRPLAASR